MTIPLEMQQTVAEEIEEVRARGAGISLRLFSNACGVKYQLPLGLREGEGEHICALVLFSIASRKCSHEMFWCENNIKLIRRSQNPGDEFSERKRFQKPRSSQLYYRNHGERKRCSISEILSPEAFPLRTGIITFITPPKSFIADAATSRIPSLMIRSRSSSDISAGRYS